MLGHQGCRRCKGCIGELAGSVGAHRALGSLGAPRECRGIRVMGSHQGLLGPPGVKGYQGALGGW